MDTWFDERTIGRAIAHHARASYPSRSCPWLRFPGECLARLRAERGVRSALLLLVTALCPVSAATCDADDCCGSMSAICLLFGMHFHNLAHRPARSAIMRLAQRLHLVCPPAHHWVHHHNQTIHYCVVNGWANYVCDGLHVWRGLERVIQARHRNCAARRRWRVAAALPGNRRTGRPAAASAGDTLTSGPGCLMIRRSLYAASEHGYDRNPCAHPVSIPRPSRAAISASARWRCRPTPTPMAISSADEL